MKWYWSKKKAYIAGYNQALEDTKERLPLIVSKEIENYQLIPKLADNEVILKISKDKYYDLLDKNNFLDFLLENCGDKIVFPSGKTLKDLFIYNRMLTVADLLNEEKES